MFRKMKQNKLLPTQEKFDTLIGATTEIYTEHDTLSLHDALPIYITAHRVMVAGKIEGNIYATERAEFHKDSEVRGDITYGTIGVEHGAKLLGLVIQAQNNVSSTTDAQAVIKMAQEKK